MADPLSPPATAAQGASAPAMKTTLPSRPASSGTTKKPRLPTGARILSRTLNTSRPPHHSNHAKASAAGAPVTRADPHLAPKRRIVIRRGTNLVAILKRVQKLLDKSPGGALSMGLGDLVGGGKKGGKGGAGATGKKGGAKPSAAEDDGVQVGDDRFPVVVVGAGALNIEKALKTAAVFQRRGDCVVRIYTSTVSGVDTYEVEEDEDEDCADGHDAGADADTEMSGIGTTGNAAGGGRTLGGRATVVKQRSRKASALEVAIRLKT
ncbi:hypothetical protein MGG_02603 [Pyricularia oryzae 70-15]|uniref:Uncharacterized protein n=3 Tax=Pyricularia oryzae TaxID=318829 RepID=G5EGW4_PYRO7|nr:uncharacterized protein MGG_02603 [Pyricularia oryzae 70-15]ELQ36355.1 hypothetical protein OOU_Y34scaffold00666g216 [Pyricularia oryzae Y34]KAI6286408.1 hypothetical protein MCOR26_001107 [Pyricularia oryzae]EAQ70915.1 hypothetical protein MGCH7_ch7g322 [Pyricularia oryzae 70-15]EHA46450.1 hypothetical protein MGG_02603 [Pyricularia oryzae 70-15]KAI6312615.1 hypothetical protein MCOR34_005537 [Pyricularia oryzae]